MRRRPVAQCAPNHAKLNRSDVVGNILWDLLVPCLSHVSGPLAGFLWSWMGKGRERNHKGLGMGNWFDLKVFLGSSDSVHDNRKTSIDIESSFGHSSSGRSLTISFGRISGWWPLHNWVGIRTSYWIFLSCLDWDIILSSVRYRVHDVNFGGRRELHTAESRAKISKGGDIELRMSTWTELFTYHHMHILQPQATIIVKEMLELIPSQS